MLHWLRQWLAESPVREPVSTGKRRWRCTKVHAPYATFEQEQQWCDLATGGLFWTLIEDPGWTLGPNDAASCTHERVGAVLNEVVPSYYDVTRTRKSVRLGLWDEASNLGAPWDISAERIQTRIDLLASKAVLA